MNKTTWIFKKKFNTQRRKDALIDKFMKIFNEHEKDTPISRYDSIVDEEFRTLTEEEIQELVDDLEEHYRKPLRIVK